MTVATLPRLGFLGVGWIGRRRMEALAREGLARVTAVADPEAEALEAAVAVAPGAARAESLEELLEHELDGVVIATPSALHAEQATAALERGLAVFCQKPLSRDAEEARRVLRAAREADRLLAVDLSYRHVEALRAARALTAAGEIGRLHSLDLAFHNAYGPDKRWFTQPELSGGGCLIDLGTHLLDLALWFTGATGWEVETARALALRGGQVEDQASAELTLGEDVRARLACSWFQPAGGECAFECAAWGSEGAVSVRNVGGSFYDFRAELWRGTSTEVLVEPGDEDWGGGAIGAWAQQLGDANRYDPAADELELLAEAIDDVYGKAGR